MALQLPWLGRLGQRRDGHRYERRNHGDAERHAYPVTPGAASEAMRRTRPFVGPQATSPYANLAASGCRRGGSHAAYRLTVGIVKAILFFGLWIGMTVAVYTVCVARETPRWYRAGEGFSSLGRAITSDQRSRRGSPL